MTNRGDGRTLRMKNPQGKEVYLKIRRDGDKYKFNARDGDGWTDFKLDDLRASLVGGASSEEETPATP